MNIISSFIRVKMKKFILCILLHLTFIFTSKCQESSHMTGTGKRTNKIWHLNRRNWENAMKPFNEYMRSPEINIPEIKKNSNNGTFEVCAGPELCPLCWEPVLHSIITDLDYTIPSENEMESFYQKKVLYKTEIPNNTSDKIVVNANFSKVLLNTFHWKFKEFKNVSVKIVLSTSIPFPTPERESNASFYLDVMDPISDDTIFWSESMEYSGRTEIVIAPFEIAHVVAYSKWVPEHLVIPFVSHVEFISPKMAACWICNNNGYVCMEASLSGQNISDILSRKGFGGEIVEVRQNSVVASLRGIFSGSYGTHTTFVVKNEQVDI